MRPTTTFPAIGLHELWHVFYERQPAGRPRTVLWVQNMLYHAQIWHLVRHGRRLFPAQFLAEPWGPFSPRLHELYTGREAVIVAPDFQPSHELLAYLDEVMEAYRDFSDEQLQALSQHEAPWANTPRNQVISDDFLIEHYTRLLRLSEEAEGSDVDVPSEQSPVDVSAALSPTPVSWTQD